MMLSLSAPLLLQVVGVELLDLMDSPDSLHLADWLSSSRMCFVFLSIVLPRAAHMDLDMLKFAAELYIPRTHFDTLLVFLEYLSDKLADLECSCLK